VDATAARRALAALWAFDGLLQLLPRMFAMAMVASVLRPPTVGEPTWLAHLTQAVLVLGTDHLIAFNVGLAAVQIGLGVALWTRGGEATWPGWASLAWCAVVWVFGEAFGGLLTGQASLVTGAPGSVALYALLTWAAWPRPAPRRREHLAWALAGTWALGAALQAAPGFLTGPGLAGLLLGNVNPLQPAWVDALMRWGARGLGQHPVTADLALLGGMAALAAGIAWPRSRRAALALSLPAATLIWAFGQAFGMLCMAMTTDPNTGPLLALLALAAWPRAEAAHLHGLPEERRDLPRPRPEGDRGVRGASLPAGVEEGTPRDELL
jgi:hypothetical protein